MSSPAELIAALRALVAGVADAVFDPEERLDALMALATASGGAEEDQALAAVGRRTALAALARAVSDWDPRSFDDAVGRRDRIIALFDAEEIAAADDGQDAVAAALRALRGAVDRDLTRRAANLSPLRPVTVQAQLPALVLAQHLYGDARREGELTRMAGDPPNPCFMPSQFRALAR
ncbi:hypothetical protein [Roseomonas xinghualingensis]|uniref:hypothetical protein n=1 Tax=Roseomonas xinghualingensis TaxID=2986475 RepID=UPI0021F2212E|nr:hypothetical protein [Roseomonas sp. SXEYE001]MCV4207575.1 hypothetical protein [Roseomonas sp. SXEYE001]